VAVTPLAGTCGAAVDQREPVIVTDSAESPLFAGLRDIILDAGIGTIWSTPFFSKDGRVLGTFVMFDRQAREPSEASGAVTWSDELYRIFGVQPLAIEPAREAMAFLDRRRPRHSRQDCDTSGR
jgi:hypothetical protein